MINLLLDIFFIPLFKITIWAAIIFVFCPFLKTMTRIQYKSGIFLYNYEQETIPKTPENVFKNLVRLPESIVTSKESKVALLTGKQQQDLMISAWKSLVTTFLVLSFQAVGIGLYIVNYDSSWISMTHNKIPIESPLDNSVD